jgi:site-specific recombinase XerD
LFNLGADFRTQAAQKDNQPLAMLLKRSFATILVQFGADFRTQAVQKHLETPTLKHRGNYTGTE